MKVFNRWTLSFKLLATFAGICAVLLAVGVLSHWSLTKTAYEYRMVTTVNFPKALSLDDMRTDARNALSYLLQLSLAGNDAKEQERLSKTVKEALVKYDSDEQRYIFFGFKDEKEKALYEQVKQTWQAVRQGIDINLPLAESGGEQERKIFGDNYRGEFRDKRHIFYSAVDALIAFQRDDSDAIAAAARAIEDRSKATNIILVICGFVLSLTLGSVISRRLTRQLSGLAQLMAQGAREVWQNSQNLSQSSADLSSSATEQAAAIQETSASVEELNAMVAKNANNAMQSCEVAKNSNQMVLHGKDVVDEMVKAMGDIDQSNASIMQAVETSNRRISEITAVIAEIADKTKVINDIVFQTKLLSFNASVEAARAGEHGKGFAVVAEEVGSLAQMSGNAAREIGALLSDSTTKVEAIVKETKDSVGSLVSLGRTKVEKGRDVAGKCGQVLQKLVESVSEMEHMIDEIATASQEQSQGIKEITKAMNQLDEAINANASSTQVTSQAAHELSAQADVLNQAVQQLRAAVYGQRDNAGHLGMRQQQAAVSFESVPTLVSPMLKDAA